MKMQKRQKEAQFLKSSFKKKKGTDEVLCLEARSLQFNICSSANRHFSVPKFFFQEEQKKGKLGNYFIVQPAKSPTFGWLQTQKRRA